LDTEAEGTTMIQNVVSCEEIFPLGLLGPGDEGTTILQNYLPRDIALYSPPPTPPPPAPQKKGNSKLHNYALYATIRQVVGHCIYGYSTKTTTTTI
jgi:hypothetical protein